MMVTTKQDKDGFQRKTSNIVHFLKSTRILNYIESNRQQ